VLGKPMAVNIEPVNICNLKCTECPTGTNDLTRPKGSIATSAFTQYIEQIKKTAWHVNLYFQGEPFMHPEFAGLVRIAKNSGLVTSTSTNGHYLSYNKAKKVVEAGLDIAIVSYDGITQDIYEKYRVGGDLDKVKEGIENLNKAKKDYKSGTPLIIGQFLAFNHNEHQINKFKTKALKYGFDKAEIKSAQVYNVKSKQHLLPLNNRFSRYKVGKTGDVNLKGKIKNRCWKHWSSCVITWDGSIVPCCFDKNADHNLGNLNEVTIGEVWGNEIYYKFRSEILKKQSEIDICKNCPLSRSSHLCF
jgi:radical SAM protein with 4Fe4S-binding SPASM domain